MEFCRYLQVQADCTDFCGGKTPEAGGCVTVEIQSSRRQRAKRYHTMLNKKAASFSYSCGTISRKRTYVTKNL